MTKKEDQSHIRDTIIAILLKFDMRLNYLEIQDGGSPGLAEKEIMELAKMMDVNGNAHQVIQRSETEYQVRHNLVSKEGQD